MFRTAVASLAVLLSAAGVAHAETFPSPPITLINPFTAGGPVDVELRSLATQAEKVFGVPVIVGGRGDPNERTVVSTASYEAREQGVHSGMPLRLAVRKSPEAVLLPVDFPVYEEISARVMETLRAHPGAIVEVLGWDEAFVGVESEYPEGTARQIQAAVLEATELHC